LFNFTIFEALKMDILIYFDDFLLANILPQTKSKITKIEQKYFII